MGNIGDGVVAHVVPRFFDAPLLERVVGKLREIERRNGIERTLAVGKLILEEFFAGDASLWRDRRRGKNNSVRRLAERPDCPFSRSSLNEALAVYVASLHLPCVRTFGHIGTGHVASVLTLPLSEQEAMLEGAEREHLSVRELRERVVSARRTAGERRGRPALQALERAISAIESDVRRLTAAIRRLGSLGAADSPAQVRLAALSAELSAASALLVAVAAGPAELRKVSEPHLRERAG
jgi:hypothetical protein